MLADLDLSPLSKETYRQGLRALIRCLHAGRQDDRAADDLSPYPIAGIDEETLYNFRRWLRQAYPDHSAGRARSARADAESAPLSRTTRTYLVAAKRLMNWLDLHSLLPEGVSYDRMVRRIDQGRGHRRESYHQRQVDPEVTRVLTHYARQPLPDRSGPGRLTVLRNRVLMALLYDTGTRVSEALALSREDVLDGRAHRVRLVVTKNDKPRTVFLSEETQRLIVDYVKERTDTIRAPLFVSHGRGPGRAITASHAWLIVKRAAVAEGLFATTSPHSLRHRRAQDLLDEGMPLEWVAALLGHQHPDTTRIVYAWETDEERLGDMVSTYGFSPSEAQHKRASARVRPRAPHGNGAAVDSGEAPASEDGGADRSR
jgi:site-specific recombinase XerD